MIRALLISALLLSGATLAPTVALAQTIGGGGGSSGGGTTNATIVGPLGTGAAAAGVSVTLDSTDAAALQSIITGVTGAIPAGSALIGKVGIDQTTPGTTNGVVVNSGPCSGSSVKSFIVAANTTSVAVDANPGSVCGVGVYGIAAAQPVWVKLYNIAQGSTTCGTSAVTDRVLGATVSTGGGAVISLPGGVTYATAITACVVQGIADNDTTAPAATSYVVSIYYK